MDFSFSEEQTAIRELAREILGKEASVARVQEVEQQADWFDRDLWAKLAEANLLGIAIPEAQGGMGMGFVELCILLEEAGRVVAPLPLVEGLVLGALTLARFGSDAQRETWLPRLASGQALLTGAPDDTGSDDVAAPATAVRADAGTLKLDGAKRDVGFASAADRVLVPASGADGVGIYLVDPQGPGVSLTSGTQSTGEPLFALELSGAELAPESRLGGAETDGAVVAEWMRLHATLGVCALQLGVCARALEITTGYVRERQQFGVPIGSFQAVQHRCADTFIDVEAIRWCMWRAAWRLDQGLPAAREVAVAKFWAAEAGARVAGATLHLHGGIGSDVDYPIHRHFLWSKALELRYGGAAPQLARLGRDMARTGPQEDAAITDRDGRPEEHA